MDWRHTLPNVAHKAAKRRYKVQAEHDNGTEAQCNKVYEAPPHGLDADCFASTQSGRLCWKRRHRQLRCGEHPRCTPFEQR
eukprot:1740914-Amphidinium_carterae.1